MKLLIPAREILPSAICVWVLLGSIGCDNASTPERSPNFVSSEIIVQHGSPEDIKLNSSAKHVLYPPAPKPIDILVKEGVWFFGDEEKIVDFNDAKASLVSILGPPDLEEESVNVTGGLDGSLGSLPTKLIWEDYGIAAEISGDNLEALYFVLCDPPDYGVSVGMDIGLASEIHASTSYSGTITVRRSHADGSQPVIKEKYVKAGMSRNSPLLSDGRDIDVYPVSQTSECVLVAKLVNTRSISASR